jgi:hypothetical protein
MRGVSFSHRRAAHQSEHAGEPDSWRSFAPRVVADHGRWHFFPVAVEEGPLVLRLAGERSHSTERPIQLGETFRSANLASWLSDGLVEIVLLDPYGQLLVVLVAALVELLVNSLQGLEVDDTVNMLWYIHGRWTIARWHVRRGIVRIHVGGIFR